MDTKEIQSLIMGDVRGDIETREEYSHDYSIFKVTPEAVIFPKTREDVQTLVKEIARRRMGGEDISLTARSAGTDMTGGPLTKSLLLVFTKYLNKILEITSDYIRVEPGVYFRDVERILEVNGLFYPAYTASKDLCAIGGMIANNSGGEKTLAYGKTEKYVRELKVILSDGEEHVLRPLSREELEAKEQENTFEGDIYRKVSELIQNNRGVIERARPNVSKNSAGYGLWNVWRKDGAFDLSQLIVGSQGTLGIVTEAKLGVLPKPRYNRLAVIFLKNLTRLADLILYTLQYKPKSLESYDDKTFRMALRFLPGLIKGMKGNAVLLGLRFLPELKMILLGGLPRMVILAEFSSDSERELEERLKQFSSGVKGFGVRARILKDEAEAEKYWTIRRQSFKLLHEHTKGKETAPFIDDVVVRPSDLPEFIPQLNAILEPYGNKLIYTIAGHPGDGNFHVIPLMDFKDPEIRKLIPEISDKVYNLVLRYHGSITGEHNDGLIRTPYLPKMYGPEVIKLFEEVKNIFDPLGIFNPGKKVKGSLEYALQHIKK